MKNLLILISLLVILLCSQWKVQAQNSQKLTVVKIDYSLETKRIDTIVYSIGQAAPITRIDNWTIVGKVNQPMQFKEYIAERKVQLDSTFQSIKKNKGIIKTYAYNDIKAEWFVHLKTKRTRFRKVYHWITYYHEYHEMYITTRTKFKFDRKNRLIHERTIDTYSREVEDEVYYHYDQ